MRRRRTSVERPSSRRESTWFETISRVRANQNAESPVSTRPLSGISVGSTTSNVEIRSLATSSSRAGSSSKISRTLPLATCTASGNCLLLLGRERRQALEQDIDVLESAGEIERSRHAVGPEPLGDLGVGLD